MATPILPLEKVAQLLGCRDVLGQHLRSHADLIPLLREGLPYRALEVLCCRIGISVNTAATCLRLPRRTLARRKEQNRLDTLESERILRLAATFARSINTFGSVQHGRVWLITENRGLGGVAPITLLDTDVGARAVEEALIAIYPGHPI